MQEASGIADHIPVVSRECGEPVLFRSGRSDFFYRFFEVADAFGESFAQFGKFPGSEKDYGYSQDYEQMAGLEQIFDHNVSI